MTLTTRLCAFFLAILALVLVGFSLFVWFLARAYLDRAVNDALQSALDTLAAAAEVGKDGVEWEPYDRPPALSADVGAEHVHWVARGDGRTIDHSSGTLVEGLFDDRLAQRGNVSWFETVDALGHAWRLKQRCIGAGDTASERAGGPGEAHEEDDGHRYQSLVVSAAVSLEPMQAMLGNLALATSSLSGVLWALAAYVGRGLCRRALRPVTRMAQAARTMNAAEMGARLPQPSTGDELEQFAHAFNDLLGRLQRSFEQQRRFTGDASHQLRTPLTALLGQIEVALRRDREPDEYRRVLAVVQSRAVELKQLVESLLFLARADAEAQLPDMATIDLADWLREHSAAWNEHPRWADVRLEMSSGDHCRVDVHPPLLAQLVDNLLDNAYKHSQVGTPIRLRLERLPNEVALTIEDRGIGIAPDELAHVFDPFYRSPRAREAGLPGTGLGLAVAARIAAAFEGRMDITSLKGQGSRFTLYLPSRHAARIPSVAETSGTDDEGRGRGDRRIAVTMKRS